MSDDLKDASSVFAADLLKLDVPAECREGVETNLRLLASHARTLETWLDQTEAAKP